MYLFYIYFGNIFNVYVKILMYNVKKIQVSISLEVYFSFYMVLYCSVYFRGFKIIIGFFVIFVVVITLVLVFFIYFGKFQVWIWMGLGYLYFVMNEMFILKSL